MARKCRPGDPSLSAAVAAHARKESVAFLGFMTKITEDDQAARIKNATSYDDAAGLQPATR